MHYLGIEIGGTKLQLGVGDAQSEEMIELIRADVDPAQGAAGIIRQIEQNGAELLTRHDVAGIGVGFGGPVDSETGRVTKSHQISGWDGVPLADHLRDFFDCPAVVDNDCNVAALAEAALGAGRHVSRVFYVTVGTGIGGGFVVGGRLHGSRRPAIAEIGHLRPGLAAVAADTTVESIASGWGIANATRQLILEKSPSNAARELFSLCDGAIDRLTTKQIAERAGQGNTIAREVMTQATRALGWAIAQVITLLAPEIVVVGGGVSLMGQPYFADVRREAARYVFPPLASSYTIVPAELREEVVVHGALILAAFTSSLNGPQETGSDNA